MKRRDVIKLMKYAVYCTAGGAVFHGIKLPASDPSMPTARLAFPLVAERSPGNVFYPELSERSMRIAKYVLEGRNQPFLLDYENETFPLHDGDEVNYQEATATMRIGDMRVRVQAKNKKEDSTITTLKADELHFWFRPFDGWQFQTSSLIIDGGLDGICTFGLVEPQFSPTGDNIGYVNWVYHRGRSMNTEIWNPAACQRVFQDLSTKVLDFYETPMRVSRRL